MKRCWKAAFLLAAGFVASCTDSGTDPGPTQQGRFYLEKEFVNTAWGRYVCRGLFVDNAGLVITYDVGLSGIPWQGMAGELYTEAELWSKIHHNDTVRGQVTADTLAWLRHLAYASVSGKMSDTTGTGADMGLVTYSCYTFEGGQGLLRKTELRAEGILEYHNTSPNAKALADWMARIR